MVVRGLPKFRISREMQIWLPGTRKYCKLIAETLRNSEDSRARVSNRFCPWRADVDLRARGGAEGAPRQCASCQFLAKFGKMLLVFGCIGSDFCKKLCVLQHFSKSTRFSSWNFWNVTKFCKFCDISNFFAEISRKLLFFQTDFLRKFWDCSGAKGCKSCRAWRMLSNAYFLAKFRFDTAEYGPAKNLQNFRKMHFRKIHFSIKASFLAGGLVALPGVKRLRRRRF